jgi:DNA-binding NarL/FixJ family response regulator
MKAQFVPGAALRISFPYPQDYLETTPRDREPRGYILKAVDPKELISQIRHAARGGLALAGETTVKLVSALSDGTGAHEYDQTFPVPLTPREGDVLKLVAQRMSNKEIAEALSISENTVRAHMRSLLQKLKVTGRTQLAIFHTTNGIALEDQNAHLALGLKSLSE